MSLDLEHREIVEIIRQTDSGVTEPFLCRADDDLLYCVKGRGIMSRGKIAEVICAIAGREIGLPIPDFCITNFSDGLRRFSQHIEGVASIGLDPAFSSRWIEPVDNFSIAMQQKYPREILAKIFIFDQWINNGDRTLTESGGNVNLLVDLAEDALVVIDHNLAFSGPVLHEEAILHVGYPAWRTLSGREGFIDHVKGGMIAACARLEGLADVLPVEWLEQEPHFVDDARDVLGRVAAPAFWSNLP